MKQTAVVLALLALLALPTTGLATPTRVTQGEAQAILQAFGNGGWALVRNGSLEGAPADFRPGSTARITPEAAWNGRHFCSLDWHVVGLAVVEGNAVGGTRTNLEIIEFLSQIRLDFVLDGLQLETVRTAPTRFLNPESRGLAEAFYLHEGKVMAPEDLAVGPHVLGFTGHRPGRPPNVFPPVTFFIDAAGEGVCV